MRTTLTLEPDVERMLREEARRAGKPFKVVVNDAIRRGLAPGPTKAKRYRVRPHVARLLGGVDPGRLNALADELEDITTLARAVDTSADRSR